MYHAPVSLDADTDREDAPDEGVDSLAFDAASERLRAAHLHNRQVEARALFAPFFGVIAALAAMITAWSMVDTVQIGPVVGWVALVMFANWTSPRRAMESAAMGNSRTAPPRAQIQAVVEAVGLAILWTGLPTYAFATQPPHVQVVIGGAMAAMITAAIALAAIRAAAIAWIATLTASLCVAYYLGGGQLDPKIGLTFLLVAGAGAYSVSLLTRWTFGQLKAIARTTTQAESIRLLLKEYEHRGVGWLWQVVYEYTGVSRH